ncbi:DUF4388 domain-containing protein [Geothrix fuzhouensis]|uniref:DUF4388 domain-containing protein n=1 Tax=Geothrix fuzhouensis TaxID=2966451 RepID=UPI00214742B7|nr:DUF4388 domain-containing protein [Geothrix fuzhouensis]
MSLLALKDLFARHRAGATGLWRLGQEPSRTIFFDHGEVVFASSGHLQDRLTHLLVERGKLTQVQLDYAMANLNPTMSIGRNLIEMGFITQRDLLDVARAQVERVVWSAMAGAAEPPTFESKVLDASTVRLPFDTPAILLSGVLNLQDRERLLAELGPLDQVVVLEGRRPAEFTLPPDLVRIPALLDDHRTLLELSRESGVEPFRLGAFILFLREMGWARLQESPSLVRLSLEPARELAPAPAVVAPSVPQPSPSYPSLIEEIQASQLPTTNLEHLSEALDELGPENEVADPTPQSGFQPPPHPEPALPIHQTASGSTELPESPYLEPRKASRRPLVLFLILLTALGLWGGLRWYKRNPIILPRLAKPAPLAAQSPAPNPEPPASATPAPPPARTATPTTPTPEPAPVPAATDTQGPLPAKPKPTPKPSAVPSKAERLKAIRDGNWKLSLTQGAAHRLTLQGKWSLRLEIACQGETIQHAAGLLKGQDPDLFLLPMTMRGGRRCYQVFLGGYESETAALAAAKRLPPAFHTQGNRPMPFRVDQIPSRQ